MKITIEKLAKRNFIFFVILSVIGIGILIFGIYSSFTNAFNLLFSPFKFDLEQALEDKPLISLNLGYSNIGTNEVSSYNSYLDAMFFAGGLSSNAKDAEIALLFHTKYEQSLKYMFKVIPDDIQETGLKYETDFRVMGAYAGGVPTHKYVRCVLGEATFFAKVRYEFDVDKDKTLKGVFVPYSSQTLKDFKKVMSGYEPLENVFGYEFDTITSFFWERVGALVWIIICLILLSLLLRKLVTQIENPSERPLYRKIKLLGGNITSVNEQLKDAQRYGKKYITKDWVLIPGIMFSSITRNVR